MWAHPCAHVVFDTDPAPRGRMGPAQVEEMSQAMIRWEFVYTKQGNSLWYFCRKTLNFTYKFHIYSLQPSFLKTWLLELLKSTDSFCFEAMQFFASNRNFPPCLHWFLSIPGFKFACVVSAGEPCPPTNLYSIPVCDKIIILIGKQTIYTCRNKKIHPDFNCFLLNVRRVSAIVWTKRSTTERSWRKLLWVINGSINEINNNNLSTKSKFQWILIIVNVN